MVIAKPILFTMVSAVPFDSAKVLFATKVENKGESAITTMPQKVRIPIKIRLESIKKNKGEKTQHTQDKNKASVAVLFNPKLCDK